MCCRRLRRLRFRFRWIYILRKIEADNRSPKMVKLSPKLVLSFFSFSVAVVQTWVHMHIMHRSTVFCLTFVSWRHYLRLPFYIILWWLLLLKQRIIKSFQTKNKRKEKQNKKKMEKEVILIEEKQYTATKSMAAAMVERRSSKHWNDIL